MGRRVGRRAAGQGSAAVARGGGRARTRAVLRAAGGSRRKQLRSDGQPKAWN